MNDNNVVIERINSIAKKVYRNNKDAVFMLINDLEEFFEINKNTDNTNMMTSEEFEKYIKNIMEE
ncbi:MAG: hypothetical protein IJ300_06665 [Clostridia bacterium]|nr:hypothetical protein [Clostridia bacterium]